jgi:hypothetical protein
MTRRRVCPSSGLATGFRSILFGGLTVVRMVFVACFLKVLLQLLFSVAAALANAAHLLRGRGCVGVQVLPVVSFITARVVVHKEILPPRACVRKTC